MKLIVIGSISAGISAVQRLTAGERSHQVTVYEMGGFYSCGAGGCPTIWPPSFRSSTPPFRARRGS